MKLPIPPAHRGPARPAVVVGAGAALGAIGRWTLDQWWPSPWSLWTANVIGSFVIGWLWRRGHDGRTRLGLFAATGFCGGLTSFSSFAAVIARRLLDGDAGDGALHAAATIVGTLAAVGCGYWSSSRTLGTGAGS